MTEEQWPASTDPVAMLSHLLRYPTGHESGGQEYHPHRPSDRKLRLFREVVVGLTKIDDLAVAPTLGWDFWYERMLKLEPSRCADMLRDIVGNPFKLMKPVWAGEWSEDWAAPSRQPFAIARSIYDDRRYEDCPILADALEDAGCPAEEDAPCPACEPYHHDTENPWGVQPGYHPQRDPASGRHEGGWANCKTCNGGAGRIRPGVVRIPNPLLAHLRCGSVHVRGCWVLDLILGKE